jgi:hypothetical protein
MRLLVVVLLLALAACGTPQGDRLAPTSILIDQPTSPFPYNSRFCP